MKKQNHRLTKLFCCICGKEFLRKLIRYRHLTQREGRMNVRAKNTYCCSQGCSRRLNTILQRGMIMEKQRGNIKRK